MAKWLRGLCVLVVAIGAVGGAIAMYLKHVRDVVYYGDAAPLHREIIDREFDKAAAMVDKGANVHATMRASKFPETWDATPLHLAARRDAVGLVERLLRARADRDAFDSYGFTPLTAALQSGADGAAQVLIRWGSPARQVTPTLAVQSYGQPITLALAHCSIETVNALIKAGANPAMDCWNGVMADVGPPDTVAKLKVLVARDISVEGETSDGWRALHVAAMNNDVRAVEYLLDRGAEIEAVTGQTKQTPVVIAAAFGANEAMAALIRRGANPAAVGEFPTLVHVAACHGQRETVRLLLSMHPGIDIRAGRRSDGATPLHLAYWNNDAEMAEMLIRAGADPMARTVDGRTPKEFVRNNGR